MIIQGGPKVGIQ